LPGAYEITATAAGFSTVVRTGITLTVGQEQSLNLTLKVGSVTEKVQVTGQAPIVQLSTSTISEVVTGTDVRDLPLNGRDWTLLATLQPGISSVAQIQNPVSASASRGSRGYGTELTIAGTRPQQNNYRIDGITVNDYTNDGPGSVLGASLGVDAIQEFSVLTANYSAEYGRTSGGVVNAITRSGVNSFHGDVYEFLRNAALDAPTFLDNEGGIQKPPFRQNQFGAAAGGPIRKDRTFFFADYEGVRQSLGSTSLNIVPSPNARNGILNFASPAAFPVGCVPTIVANQCQLTVDANVQPFLALWPLPNGALIAPGNTGKSAVAVQQTASEDFGTGRVDHKISDKDSIFASYEYDTAVLDAPDALNDERLGNVSSRQLISVEESHTVNPQLVNTARFGFSRSVALNGESVSAINPLELDKSLGAVPGFNAPKIAVTGITTHTGGIGAPASSAYYWNSFQGYDDAFLTRGNHALKFGVALEGIDLNLNLTSTPQGQFSYGSLVNFLTNQGQGATFSAPLPGFATRRNERQRIFGTYLQDDIRWRPNLTVNLGVRYEMSTVPTEAHGRTSSLLNLTDPLPHCGVLVTGCAAVGPLFSNPTLHNFEPRIGFAWDPFHNGKTSVRGAFGMFDVLPLPYMSLTLIGDAAPFAQSGSINPVPNGAFPTGAFNAIVASGKLRTPYFEPNPPRSYLMTWNLNVQRELLPNLNVMVAYVGSHGVHQPEKLDDVNQVLPTATPQGFLWPCGGTFTATGLCTDPGTGTVLNPLVGRMEALMWWGSSFYDGLELQITKTMSHGFKVQGAYTWSKAIDDGSTIVSSNGYLNSVQNLLWFDPRANLGVSDFNVAQKLVINYIWQLPEPRSLPSAALWLLGGWQTQGIFTASTGLPFTPVVGGDPTGQLDDAPVDYPNRLVGPGCQSAVNPGNFNNYIKLQCFTFPDPSTLLGNTRRNSLTGPGLVNVDFSLFKNNYVRENLDVQFRAEFYNTFNHANFAAPINNQTLFDQFGNPVGGAGQINALATPAREIQFGLKLIW
jgi:hypothetical protein